MWDQLPVRADNPSASKYTSSPLRPRCFIALHCAPSFREAAGNPNGPNWVWSCIPFPNALTVVGEMLEMFCIAAGRYTAQSQGRFVFTRGHSVSVPWKQHMANKKGLWLLSYGIVIHTVSYHALLYCLCQTHTSIKLQLVEE